MSKAADNFGRVRTETWLASEAVRMSLTVRRRAGLVLCMSSTVGRLKFVCQMARVQRVCKLRQDCSLSRSSIGKEDSRPDVGFSFGFYPDRPLPVVAAILQFSIRIGIHQTEATSL